MADAVAAPPPIFVTKCRVLGRDLLRKGLQMVTGKTIDEVGIEAEWIEAYAMIAERTERDRKTGLSRFVFEPGVGILAMAGGFFDHKEWPLRRALEKHQSMRTVAEYEAKYVNSAGYWLTFNQAAYALREELGKNDEAAATRFDVWAFISVQYALRVLGLRTQFYELAADDPMYARLVLPSLEKESVRAHADNLDKPMETLDSHMSTQLMKAVATLNASNATKRAGRNGGAAQKD